VSQTPAPERRPPAPDGRMRAVVALVTAGLDTASFVVRAVWLVCVVVLAFVVVTIIGAVGRAVF